MQNAVQLPDHVKKAFALHEIWPAAVKAAAASYLPYLGKPGEVWVILCDGLLAVSSGTGTGACWVEIGFQSYLVNEVEVMTVENLVSSGMLTCKINGEEREICRFSNTSTRSFVLMAKLFTKLKEGRELVDEDYIDEKPVQYCPKCGLAYPEQERLVCPKCIDRRSVFFRVLSFVPRYKFKITLILLCMFASSALNLASPYIGGSILFDEVLAAGGRYSGMVIQVVLLIVAVRLVALLISIVYGRINAGITSEVIYDLKTEIYSAMQRLSLGFYNGKQTGNLMTRVNTDANHLQYFFHDGLPYFIVNLANIIGISIIMALIDWKLTLLVFLPSPIIVIYLRKLFPRLWKLFGKNFRKASAMNSLINDSLTGFRVVKAFGKEHTEIERFADASNGVAGVELHLGRLMNTSFPLIQFGMGVGSLIIWGFGGWLVVGGNMTFGTLMTFIGYIGMIYGPLDFMTHIVDWWSSCMNSAHRMFEILDAVPQVADRKDPVNLTDMQGDIVLGNVSFSYEPNKPVLQDISFEVKAGEMLGLVGHSGAGKSTIANLITRLYDVKEGSILIDGFNIKDIRIKDLRSNIGVVSQETFLFMGTVAENIAYSKPGAAMHEIIFAAKAANAHGFIMKMPDAYNTVIGIGGQDLSGGERQRVSIARAILHNPKILILDEATSSVDTETEGMIQDALEKLIKGRTTISIAHRLSTLRGANKLVILENGKIAEAGTHSELIRLKGAYYKLVNQQSEALKMRGVGD